jgi:hypothetical protein
VAVLGAPSLSNDIKCFPFYDAGTFQVLQEREKEPEKVTPDTQPTLPSLIHHIHSLSSE